MNRGLKLPFFPVATWFLNSGGGHYDTHTKKVYPVTVLGRLNCSNAMKNKPAKFARTYQRGH